MRRRLAGNAAARKRYETVLAAGFPVAADDELRRREEAADEPRPPLTSTERSRRYEARLRAIREQSRDDLLARHERDRRRSGGRDLLAKPSRRVDRRGRKGRPVGYRPPTMDEFLCDALSDVSDLAEAMAGAEPAPAGPSKAERREALRRERLAERVRLR